MKRDGWLAAALWLGLTAVGEAAVWNARIFPGGYAREAEVSDSAFRLLMRLAVPVFAFVLAVLVVSVVRHRAKGKPAEDGPPVAGSRAVYALWLAVTGALMFRRGAGRHPFAVSVGQKPSRYCRVAATKLQLEASSPSGRPRLWPNLAQVGRGITAPAPGAPTGCSQRGR